jgi:lipoprotein-anchoring transpeptidase ErfK/SrfK
MMRFFFGLMAVVAVYLGWQWYADGPALVADGLFETAREGDSNATPAAGRVAVAGLATGTGHDPQGRPAGAGGVVTRPGRESTQPTTQESTDGEAMAQAILNGESGALAGGFRRLRAAVGRERECLASALAAVVGRAEDLDSLLVALGEGNAFLHSEVGRAAARQAVKQSQALPDDQAIIRMSRLLERCMQGRIQRTDAEAAAVVEEVYGRQRILVDRVVFNPTNLTKARTHQVKPDDTLDRIARGFRKQGINVEGWTLCFANRIGRPTRLQAGAKIKIPIEPIWAKVEKESFLMAIYVGETIVRLYWVAHGVDNKTPETTFTVGAKLADPDWYAPDGQVYPFGHPGNVLGRFFVKFDHESLQGFGAHGTTEPDSIRTQASLGCIRMHDKDIEEFFRFVPRAAKVVVAASR